MASCGEDMNDSTSVILIGKTGTGKSATGNTILGKEKFKEGRGGLSKTESCKCITMPVRERWLSVIDTPGTMDVKDAERALEELLGAIDVCPNGIDAFILTFRCDVRATEEEIGAAEQALDTFGPECYKRAIVVFTRGAEYENNEKEFGKELLKIKQELPRFGKLLSKLSNRWVLLENKSSQEVKERQVKNLLQRIDAVAQLNPRRYLKNDQETALAMRQQRENELGIQFQQAIHGEKMQLMMIWLALQYCVREFGHQMEKSRLEMEVERKTNELEFERSNKSSCSLL